MNEAQRTITKAWCSNAIVLASACQPGQWLVRCNARPTANNSNFSIFPIFGGGCRAPRLVRRGSQWRRRLNLKRAFGLNPFDGQPKGVEFFWDGFIGDCSYLPMVSQRQCRWHRYPRGHYAKSRPQRRLQIPLTSQLNWWLGVSRLGRLIAAQAIRVPSRQYHRSGLVGRAVASRVAVWELWVWQARGDWICEYPRFMRGRSAIPQPRQSRAPDLERGARTGPAAPCVAPRTRQVSARMSSAQSAAMTPSSARQLV
eukprot:scaffold3340_cov255-Pinguiococcus_pyrenoidosus.AAC.18